MFDDKDLGAEVLGNPAMSQYLFLKELEKRSNGEISIADPNNGFCLLSEFFSSMTSQFIRQENKRFNALYPKRAQSPEDLYPFISDYDYVSLTASPASVAVQCFFSKQWLIENAVPYDETFNRIDITKESIFTIAGIPFTAYYTLMILVNRTTNIITVQYDINVDSDKSGVNSSNKQTKLKPMATNLPKMVIERTVNGIDWLVIVFDVYQFIRQVYTETLDSTTGFYNQYNYQDKFYAARVEWWSETAQDWVELVYSLSGTIYDINNPTALLVIDDTNKTLSVRIPQIYFTKGLIGNRVRTTIMSSKGEIDVTITEQDQANIGVDFKYTTSDFTAPLSREKYGNITTYNTTRIEGGADPLDFDEFRKRVINQTIYDQVPISNLQINAAVEKFKFSLTKHLDNLTDDRIYYAGATLTNPADGSLIPVVASKVLLKEPYNCSTIIDQSDETVTILPTTLFKYDRHSDTASPVTDDQIQALVKMSAQDYVDELNRNIYTRQPYHIWLDKSAQYPQAKSYNLMEPKMTSLMLQRENNHSPVMMNVVSVNIDHLDDGTGGYKFYIYVERSSSLKKEDIAQCKLLIQTMSRNGRKITFEAEYHSTDTQGYDIYLFNLNTTYRLYADGHIQIENVTYDGTTVMTDVGMTSSWAIKAMVSRSYAGKITEDAVLNNDVPKYYLDDYIVISHQEMTIELGEDLKNLIYNQVSTTWGPISYQTYDSNIPYTYNEDIYMTDRQGNLLTKVVTNADGSESIAMVKLFNKGDTVLSDQEASYILTDIANAGTNTLTLNDTSALLIGQIVSGTNIQAGTTVTSISDNQITISRNVMNTLPAGSSILMASTYIDTVTTLPSAKGSNTITVGNVQDILPGMTIKGFNIPDGTTVSSVSNGVITLSNNLTGDVQTGDTYVIMYLSGAKSFKYRKGDPILDGKGNPITTGTRRNVYGINLIQFDARLYESEDPNDINFVKTIPSLLSSKAHALDPIRDQLIERTYLYYLPFRTLGDATYSAGDGRKITMPLEMSYNIVYYVNEATKSNTTMQVYITQNTLTAINNYLLEGKISTNELGYKLKSNNSTLVSAIDISGIDNTAIKTVAIDTQGASPSVEKKLSINSAGQKYLVPNISVTYQVAPT